MARSCFEGEFARRAKEHAFARGPATFKPEKYDIPASVEYEYMWGRISLCEGSPAVKQLKIASGHCYTVTGESYRLRGARARVMMFHRFHAAGREFPYNFFLQKSPRFWDLL